MPSPPASRPACASTRQPAPRRAATTSPCRLAISDWNHVVHRSARSLLRADPRRVQRAGPGATARGGGTAYGGWEPGFPFFGSICLPAAPDPEPPGDPTITVEKTGALQAGDVTFTVTVQNPTNVTAPDVTLVDTLPTELTWTLPPGCSAGGGRDRHTATLAIWLAVPASTSSSSPRPVPATAGHSRIRLRASSGPTRPPRPDDSATVEVPCPPQPDDPAILITKTPTSTSVSVPGPVTYVMTAENVGPGTPQTFNSPMSCPPAQPGRSAAPARTSAPSPAAPSAASCRMCRWRLRGGRGRWHAGRLGVRPHGQQRIHRLDRRPRSRGGRCGRGDGPGQRLQRCGAERGARIPRARCGWRRWRRGAEHQHCRTDPPVTPIAALTALAFAWRP